MADNRARACRRGAAGRALRLVARARRRAGAAGLALSPFRRLVVAYFSSRAVQLVVIALSLASCGWFVAETYVDGAALRARRPSWRRTSKSIEIGFSLVFLVDYVMSCALARSIAHYALSPIGVIDLLSLAPVVAELPFAPGVTRHFGFVRFMRVLKVVRVLRLHRVMHLKLDAKSQGRVAPRVAGLALSIVGVTFVSAGLVYSLAELRPGSFTQQPLMFHDAFYFAVVTMSTVGYGDISPVTWPARLIVCVYMALCFTLIPLKVSDLIDALLSPSSRRVHGRAGDAPGGGGGSTTRGGGDGGGGGGGGAPARARRGAPRRRRGRQAAVPPARAAPRPVLPPGPRRLADLDAQRRAALRRRAHVRPAHLLSHPLTRAAPLHLRAARVGAQPRREPRRPRRRRLRARRRRRRAVREPRRRGPARLHALRMFLAPPRSRRAATARPRAPPPAPRLVAMTHARAARPARPRCAGRGRRRRRPAAAPPPAGPRGPERRRCGGRRGGRGGGRARARALVDARGGPARGAAAAAAAAAARRRQRARRSCGSELRLAVLALRARA